MKSLKWHLVFLVVLAAQTAFAEVRLPHVFGSHMVLQRRQPVPVWGWADPGEPVMVTLNNQTQKTKAGKDGQWRVTLDPMEAGGPYRMVVQGKKNTVTFEDVLTGEVWVCSGQSNMEFTLKQAANAKTEIPTANHPNIRQLLVKKDISLSPKADMEGDWQVCTPETAPNFTAVGYFFAKKLRQDLNVPIGLINTSWGGTHSETWTSREAMSSNAELKPVADKLPATYDEVIKSGAERTQKLVQSQQGSLPTATEARTWADPDLNTTQWKSMNVLGDWEWKGLPTFDGVVWFRKEVTLPEGVTPNNMMLQFGPIDDRDSTYVNGQLVGSTNGRQLPRSYSVPDGLLKPGRNVIAVRVRDTGGSGGMMGEPGQFRLSGGKIDLPLAGEWQYRIASVSESSYKPGPNTYGTQLFNAMLNPLIPYAIAGVIWYQGESNAGRAYQYRQSFPLMIQDWRQHWGRDFPFLFVQLASFNSANGDSRHGSTWAELREAQTQTLQLPNTGMAVTSDVGERNDIHPKNKLDVGNRLAAEAMRVAYDQPAGDVSRGPMFEKMVVDGNKATITFKNVGNGPSGPGLSRPGLMAKDKYGYVKGFEVAGVDQKFYYAQANIQGNTVVVHADSVATPVAVRYGWADDNGDVNLYNQAGFPAVPFRTDSWRGITEGKRFGE